MPLRQQTPLNLSSQSQYWLLPSPSYFTTQSALLSMAFGKKSFLIRDILESSNGEPNTIDRPLLESTSARTNANILDWIFRQQVATHLTGPWSVNELNRAYGSNTLAGIERISSTRNSSPELDANCVASTHIPSKPSSNRNESIVSLPINGLPSTMLAAGQRLETNNERNVHSSSPLADHLVLQSVQQPSSLASQFYQNLYQVIQQSVHNSATLMCPRPPTNVTNIVSPSDQGQLLMPVHLNDKTDASLKRDLVVLSTDTKSTPDMRCLERSKKNVRTRTKPFFSLNIRSTMSNSTQNSVKKCNTGKSNKRNKIADYLHRRAKAMDEFTNSKVEVSPIVQDSNDTSVGLDLSHKSPQNNNVECHCSIDDDSEEDTEEGDLSSSRKCAAKSKCRRLRRNRTVFTELQLMGLERRFDSQKYLSTPDRADLARALGLTQLQVKTWYQNRRMKWKKQVMQNGCPYPPTKPKGRPKKDSIPTYGMEFTNSILCPIFATQVNTGSQQSSFGELA